MGNQWWEGFFDPDYIRLWGPTIPPDRTEAEADGLWELLQLGEGMRVLDAPCGYGRLSLPLAQRGAIVVGVDFSPDLLAEAERRRGGISSSRLRYLRHDLREALPEDGFEAALNIFSSLGYGSEEDDIAILTTLRRAVRSGGFVLVETNHRDAVAAFLSKGVAPSMRLPDDTLVIEEPKLDAVSGRIETCWRWWGPQGSGKKVASLRVYTATELVKLLEKAGLRFLSAHAGCSPEPFKASGTEMGGRLALLAKRP